MSITIHLSSVQEAALRRKANQVGEEIEQFVVGLISDQLEDTKPSKAALSPEETRVMQVINRGFPEQFWRQYKSLFSKKEEETLTEAEYGELLEMVEQLEAYNVERLRALIDLAQIRGTDVETVMMQLGIHHGKG